MKSTITIHGINKAVERFNSWQGNARVYFDISDGEIWTNTYASGNEWDEYHSKTIFEVHSKLSLMDRDNKISASRLKEICDEYTDEYTDEHTKWRRDYEKLYLNIHIKPFRKGEFKRNPQYYRIDLSVLASKGEESEQIVLDKTVPIMGVSVESYVQLLNNLRMPLIKALERFMGAERKVGIYMSYINTTVLPPKVVKELYNKLKEDLDKNLDTPSTFDMNLYRNNETGGMSYEIKSKLNNSVKIKMIQKQV